MVAYQYRLFQFVNFALISFLQEHIKFVREYARDNDQHQRLSQHYQTLLNQLEYFYEKRDRLLVMIGFQYTNRKISEEEMKLKMELFFEEVQLEISKLKPIVATIESHGQSEIGEIKDLVVKNNRNNFKLFNELQQKLEDLDTKLGDSSHSNSSELIEKMKKDTKQIAQTMLEVFDQLDFINHAVHETGNVQFAASIQSSIDRVLEHFHLFGIEEIPVLNELVDGEWMESIGTISQSEAGPEYRQYQVFQVHQRGFRYTDSQQLIRKAKIISVL